MILCQMWIATAGKMKINMQFEDIRQFPRSSYSVDISWNYLEKFLQTSGELDLDPDFQRDHVWTTEQRVAFVEYILRGGTSSRDIYFNNPGWSRGFGVLQLIDGKQRLETARMFMRNELKVFGWRTCADLGGKPHQEVRFRVHVHELETRVDVLLWYLGMNNGGTVHTQEEIARVQVLLAQAIKGE